MLRVAFDEGLAASRHSAEAGLADDRQSSVTGFVPSLVRKMILCFPG